MHRGIRLIARKTNDGKYVLELDLAPFGAFSSSNGAARIELELAALVADGPKRIRVARKLALNYAIDLSVMKNSGRIDDKVQKFVQQHFFDDQRHLGFGEKLAKDDLRLTEIR